MAPKIKATKKRGPPFVLPRDMDKRYMIRCKSPELAQWEAFAGSLGFGGAAPWLRKIANDAIAALPAAKRAEIQAAAERTGKEAS